MQELCEFCHLELRKDQRIVLQRNSVRFLQLEPSEIEGAGVIVPLAHRETVFDLTEEEWADTYHLLQEVKRHIDDRHRPDGYNIGWNCGEVGGQHIFHAHLHVIPRYRDEPLAGKGIRYFFKSQGNKRPSTK